MRSSTTSTPTTMKIHFFEEDFSVGDGVGVGFFVVGVGVVESFLQLHEYVPRSQVDSRGQQQLCF